MALVDLGAKRIAKGPKLPPSYISGARLSFEWVCRRNVPSSGLGIFFILSLLSCFFFLSLTWTIAPGYPWVTHCAQ
jgi:hypothetical protein